MDDIVQKILQIETKAQQIIEDTRREEQNINDELDQESNKMQEEIRIKTENRTKQIFDDELKEGKEKLEKINQKMSSKIEAMMKYAQQNMEGWEKHLIERIIGR